MNKQASHNQQRSPVFSVIGAGMLCCVIHNASAGVVAANDSHDQVYCSAQLSSELAASYELAEQWLLSNIKEKGIFIYRYNPLKDTYPKKNNMIRQLMASRLLAELSQDQPLLKDKHRQNLVFIFKHWYREDKRGGYGYIFYNKKSKLGANAMALRTLAASPFYADYRQQAILLADGILSLMNHDGALRPWFIEPAYSYNADYLLTFYSGEAILSLLELYEVSNEDRFLAAAIKSQSYYLDKYVTHIEYNYYPAYVPWHTLSLSKLYKLTGDPVYVKAVFAMNDRLLQILDIDQYQGRFYNKRYPQYGKPHSSSDGVYTESLAYAFELATLVDDKLRRERYGRALVLAVKNLMELQYQKDDVPRNVSPHKVLGALRVHAADGRIRIDTTQHTMDAYRKLMKIWCHEGRNDGVRAPIENNVSIR